MLLSKITKIRETEKLVAPLGVVDAGIFVVDETAIVFVVFGLFVVRGAVVVLTVEEAGAVVGLTVEEAGADVGLTVEEAGADVGLTVEEAGADVGLTVEEAGVGVGLTVEEAGAGVVSTADASRSREMMLASVWNTKRITEIHATNFILCTLFCLEEGGWI